MIGVPVFNEQNEKIGEIIDLVTDTQGQLLSFVISVPSKDLGERLVEVTPNIIRFPKNVASGTAPTDPVNARWFPERAVLNATKTGLLALPEVKF